MKLLKFYATWCGPCKALSMVVESAKDKLPMTVEDVDIDNQFELAKKYNVRSVPTMIVVNDSGSEIKRAVGSMNEKQFIEFLTI
jgi:thioredoxin 1